MKRPYTEDGQSGIPGTCNLATWLVTMSGVWQMLWHIIQGFQIFFLDCSLFFSSAAVCWRVAVDGNLEVVQKLSFPASPFLLLWTEKEISVGKMLASCQTWKKNHSLKVEEINPGIESQFQLLNPSKFMNWVQITKFIKKLQRCWKCGFPDFFAECYLFPSNVNLDWHFESLNGLTSRPVS